MMDEFYSGNSCEPMTVPNVKTLEQKDMIAVLNAKLCVINLCLGTIIRKLFCISFEENILERYQYVLFLESAYGALFRLLAFSPRAEWNHWAKLLACPRSTAKEWWHQCLTPSLALFTVPPPSSEAVSAVLPVCV